MRTPPPRSCEDINARDNLWEMVERAVDGKKASFGGWTQKPYRRRRRG